MLRYQGAPGHAPFSAAERADFEDSWRRSAGHPRWRAVGRRRAGPDPGAGRPERDGGFDTTTLQYADGRPADPVAFLSLNYLVRLWRRLGWSLAETDRALQVFLPTDRPADGPPLGPAMGSALLG